MRASTLGNNVLAINREIDSRYDAVIAVKNKLPEIELVSGMDITALIQELEDAKDFSGITVIVGDVASWNPVTKVLTVPVEKGDKGDTGAKGDKGDKGEDGSIEGFSAVATAQDSQTASATVNVAGTQLSFAFGLPRGAKGDKGDQGEQQHL